MEGKSRNAEMAAIPPPPPVELSRIASAGLRFDLPEADVIAPVASQGRS